MSFNIIEHLLAGTIFIYLYQWFGITELISFATLFTFCLAEVIVLLITVVLAAILAYFEARRLKSELDKSGLANLYELIRDDDDE